MSIDGGGVYLLYIPSESCPGVDVFKIGQTQQFMQRMSDYPADAVPLRYRSCREPLRTERVLIQHYLKHVQVTKHRGREYLCGPPAVMIQIYDEYFTNHPHGEVIGVISAMSKLSVSASATSAVTSATTSTNAQVSQRAAIVKSSTGFGFGGTPLAQPFGGPVKDTFSPQITQPFGGPQATPLTQSSTGFGGTPLAQPFGGPVKDTFSPQTTSVTQSNTGLGFVRGGICDSTPKVPFGYINEMQKYQPIIAHPDVVKHVCDFMEKSGTVVTSSGTRMFMSYHTGRTRAAYKIKCDDLWIGYANWITDKFMPVEYHQPNIDIDWSAIGTEPTYTGIAKNGRKDPNLIASLDQNTNSFRTISKSSYLNPSIWGKGADGTLLWRQKIILAVYEGRLPAVSCVEHFVSVVMSQYGATDNDGKITTSPRSSIMTVYCTKTLYDEGEFCLDKCYLGHSARYYYWDNGVP